MEKVRPRNAVTLCLFGSLTGLLAVLVWSGCTIKNKGTARENEPPRVYFSTIPLTGTLFTAPGQLFWYSTDRDGYIVEFQYALIPDSLIGIAGLSAPQETVQVRSFLSRNRPTPAAMWEVVNPNGDTLRFPWVSVSNIRNNGQTAVVALPAARDSIRIINTVVFVRSRDDKEALSTDVLSGGGTPQAIDSLLRIYPNAIAWRNFRRKNRPPTTTIDGVRVANQPTQPASQLSNLVFYSLPDSTYDPVPTMQVGHLGITLLWHGADFPDYPAQDQPKFSYFWELFGPFAGSQYGDPPSQDSNRLWASTDQPVRYVGAGGSTGPRFDTATSATFYGLRGVSPTGGPFDSTSADTNIRPAFYSFRVRTRDDANVVGRPTLATIKVVRPRFDKNILLVYKQTEPFGDAEPPVRDSMLIQNFYLRLIRRAGYGSLIDSALDVKFLPFDRSIPESLLARYNLVIFHKEASYPALGSTSFLASLKAYMDVGGSVWGMGRDDLSDLIPLYNTASPVEVPFTLSDPVQGVGFFYFGAAEVFTHAHLVSVSRDSVSLEEFVGAEPLETGFPFLDIDTNVIKTYEVSGSRKDTSRYRRMPEVNYFVAGSPAVRGRLYLFRSDPLIDDTSHLHGKLVAFRADRVRFKTSFFGFPLYGIMEDQAVCLTRKMLEWFLPNPNPPPGPPQVTCP